MRKPKTEYAEFNGTVYRRYPRAKAAQHRKYFHATRIGGAGGCRYLHRDVWEFHNGPIPARHHIHHKDGNPANNDISNLECLSRSEHLRLHAIDPKKMSKADYEAMCRRLELIRVKATEWHRSAEGREWHKRNNGLAKLMQREGEKRDCVVCGDPFVTSSSRRRNERFCSPKCKAKHRRDSGVDAEERTCPACGKVFVVNKYEDKKACGRVCGQALRRRSPTP